MKMWKNEFPAEYLEDISKRTGREMSYLQFIQLLNQAILSQSSTEKSIFIDLMGYQDLQLLKRGSKVAA